jgi:hypothetical protein
MKSKKLFLTVLKTGASEIRWPTDLVRAVLFSQDDMCG